MSRATQLVSGSWLVNPGSSDFTACVPNHASILVLYSFENMAKKKLQAYAQRRALAQKFLDVGLQCQGVSAPWGKRPWNEGAPRSEGLKLP